MTNSTGYQRVNDAILPLLKLIVPENGEADQWVIIETLCCAIGRVHGRSDRQIAEFLDAISFRIATGERSK
jgi:hypothetical protein